MTLLFIHTEEYGTRAHHIEASRYTAMHAAIRNQQQQQQQSQMYFNTNPNLWKK